ncbi:MAG: acetyl-CoA decarbonylase/synthase complex subunit gamma [Caldilineales bacterium]|nr:acetyl-CoA decarbonylase/synthase complex subunit gamma [Caldilineales bacterium]MCW5857507.1 acetyl-CoA decarbonylase/synthase complex subunit gamma [Caldilineales bacterium]
MALSGIQIYKLLPQTNCKDCGFPTCLAFAMKLAAKQVELAACPHVKEDAKAQLSESAAPPVRLISLRANGNQVKAGNEVVLFRHEKTFYNRPGLFVRVGDDLSAGEIAAKVAAADAYRVNYVGIDLTIDGFAVESVAGDPASFAAAVKAVRGASQRPLTLLGKAAALAAGLAALGGETPLIGMAAADNWAEMADLAAQNKVPLIVSAADLDGLADLTEKIKGKGVEDMVLDPGARDFGASLALNTQIRRLALKKNFRPLGFPIIAFPSVAPDAAAESMLAAQAIAKYAGFVVIDHFAPEHVYPLLVLRQNIYTDPQKPIQVQPGVYEINNPKPEDPVLVTTNFSITYFSVANEVEGSGLPAWLVVADAEGMSVLTAWAAGKFDAERIAKDVKRFGLADKVARKRIVLPGHVAVLSGELEAELPGWEIHVGPREAVDLPRFMKEVL